MLHISNPRTQPWKSGLPLDPSRINNAKAAETFDPQGAFAVHPDPLQERRFFRLLSDALTAGEITTREVDDQIANGWVRPDLYEAVAEANRTLPRRGRWVAAARSGARYMQAPNR
jgi:hypothetical protein